RYDDRELLRPDLSTDTKRVTHDRIERTLGIDVPGTEVVDLLERAGLDAEPSEGDGSVRPGTAPAGERPDRSGLDRDAS
ncbi:hypothetical protein, partial [Idiomarina sp. ST10R2A5]|uniref:hypothetical protein n=1 Tax=Idiomarina sp. ST10R2A5 TaxID=3418368 RepID=UPI003EC6E405